MTFILTTLLTPALDYWYGNRYLQVRSTTLFQLAFGPALKFPCTICQRDVEPCRCHPLRTNVRRQALDSPRDSALLNSVKAPSARRRRAAGLYTEGVPTIAPQIGHNTPKQVNLKHQSLDGA